MTAVNNYMDRSESMEAIGQLRKTRNNNGGGTEQVTVKSQKSKGYQESTHSYN